VRPPVAATVWLYAAPCVAFGSDVVVMEGGGGKLIAMLRAWGAEDWGPVAPVLESVAFTVKLDVVFGPVGVPVIAPALLKLNPAGKDPAVIEKVSVPAPPDAATVWL
jgi:hypothetical protein